MTLGDLVAIWLNKNGARKKDENLVSDFNEGKARRDALEEDSSHLPFRPAGHVCSSENYGYFIFQEKALVTASEYEGLLERLPEDIKLQPTKAPFSGVGRDDTMYLIDLRNMPLNVLFSLRRCYVYYDNRAGLTEEFLSPQTQLTKDQPAEMFKFVLTQHLEKRPQQLRPLAKRPKTIEELREAYEAAAQDLQMAEERVARLKRKTLGGDSDESDSDDEAEEDDFPKEVGVGSITGGQRRKKSQAKAASVKSAAYSNVSAKPSASVDQTPKALMDEEADAVSLGSKGAKNKLFAGLDTDMTEVAEKHLSLGSGSSVKCLAHLRSKIFLLGPEDSGTPELTVKSMAAHMNGARWVLKRT